MKTALECLPCLLRQALHGAGLATDSPDIQKSIMEQACRILSDLDFNLTPPENSIRIYEAIAGISGCKDPFIDLKNESNQLALSLRGMIKEEIERTPDPLLTAIRFSIAGNIIDYGSQQSFHPHSAIKDCLSRELAINDYQELQKDLREADSVLYLADNAGEIVLDRLVIEELEGRVTIAVKKEPIINDALLADAEVSGLDKICRVMDNGTSCPGTPLDLCSPELRDEFSAADIIISKGQGNFETLSEIRAPIYFLLTVKCPVVAEHIKELTGRRVENGEMVLLKSES
ncbi:MAG: damage-control phosphatase ARMT1 family protein [Desulfurivibrionaceae bacterium]